MTFGLQVDTSVPLDLVLLCSASPQGREGSVGWSRPHKLGTTCSHAVTTLCLQLGAGLVFADLQQGGRKTHLAPSI